MSLAHIVFPVCFQVCTKSQRNSRDSRRRRIQLGNADKVRLNFSLQIATQAQSVEVTVAADTLLATSSSSVGEVLSQNRVQDLPTISNNVMEIYRLVPGIRLNADGVSGSFA